VEAIGGANAATVQLGDRAPRYVAADWNRRFYPGTFRQKAAENMDTVPVVDRDHPSTCVVRRREQQPAASRRAELCGYSHGDIRHAPALDNNIRNGELDDFRSSG